MGREMSVLPSVVDLWNERPNAGVARPLTRLVPSKTTAGYWVFTVLGAVPPGAVVGAVVHGASYATFLTSTTIGLRATKTPLGEVLLY
jgi:hypothetical protein